MKGIDGTVNKLSNPPLPKSTEIGESVREIGSTQKSKASFH